MGSKDKVCLIKAGSAVVTRENGTLDVGMVKKLCDQISTIHRDGWSPILVSSGAVASGRGYFMKRSKMADPAFSKEQPSKRLYAAIGQSRLISLYAKSLGTNASGLHSAQILLTREAFAERERYLVLRDSLYEMMDKNILPIINNNDVIYSPLLDFSDNDHLASYVAGMINADIVVFISDVDGVYDRNPKKYSDARKIDVLDSSPDRWPRIDADNIGISSGGIKSKLAAMKLMGALGIPCYLIGKNVENGLVRTIINQEAGLGTRLEISHKHSLDGFKRWLATGAYPKGILVVSTLGAEALGQKRRRASLLAVGVQEHYGRFDKGDIVSIRDDSYNLLGIGKSRFSSSEIAAGCHKNEEDGIVVHANYFLKSAETLFSNTDKDMIMSVVSKIKAEGYRVAENRVTEDKKGLIIIKNRENADVRKFEGEEAPKRIKSVRIAAKAIGVDEEEWLLFSLLGSG